MHNHSNPDINNEIGTVINIIDNQAVIEIDNKDACDSCGAKVICIPNADGKRVIKANNPINAKIGNKVMIKEDEQFFLKISIFQYGIPLIGFLTGILGLKAIDYKLMLLPEELVLFFGGILGLTICGLFSKYMISRLIRNKSVTNIFTVTKISH